MIVIFSDNDDYSTTKVMEYLLAWNENVIRINREDSVNASFNIRLSGSGQADIELTLNNVTLDLHSIKSIWFRRGGLNFRAIPADAIYRDSEALRKQFMEYFNDEQLTLNRFIYENLFASGIRILGNPFVMNTSKLSVLRKAAFYGLDLPDTLIATEKKDVINYIKKRGAIITKAIQDNISPVTKGQGYRLLTEEIDLATAEVLPDHFYPSLFQEKVIKKYDVRVFYLDGAFYSLAIFSQDNNQTSVDFRNYDFTVPNRKTIIELPESIKQKLQNLLKDLNLNTASVDLIYTQDNRYVFMEINPVGQYDMVGRLMNFQLDKKIALWLKGN